MTLFDLTWAQTKDNKVSYGDIYHQNEVEMSHYNFDLADIDALFNWFDFCEKESKKLVKEGLSIPAYEMTMKASHTFNLLDARSAISVTERQNYILRIRTLARAVAESYLESREKLGFPLAKN